MCPVVCLGQNNVSKPEGGGGGGDVNNIRAENHLQPQECLRVSNPYVKDSWTTRDQDAFFF